MTSYTHTQRGLLHHLCFVIAAGILAMAFATRSVIPVFITMVVSAVVCAFLGCCFRSLTVTDRGDRLQVAFGPLPIFRTSIAYSDVQEITVTKSKLVDGFGMHYIPGRGWTYNISGWDCVEVRQINGRLIRIGTDDPQGLADHLRSRLDHSRQS